MSKPNPPPPVARANPQATPPVPDTTASSTPDESEAIVEELAAVSAELHLKRPLLSAKATTALEVLARSTGTARINRVTYTFEAGKAVKVSREHMAHLSECGFI